MVNVKEYAFTDKDRADTFDAIASKLKNHGGEKWVGMNPREINKQDFNVYLERVLTEEIPTGSEDGPRPFSDKSMYAENNRAHQAIVARRRELLARFDAAKGQDAKLKAVEDIRKHRDEANSNVTPIPPYEPNDKGVIVAPVYHRAKLDEEAGTITLSPQRQYWIPRSWRGSIEGRPNVTLPIDPDSPAYGVHVGFSLVVEGGRYDFKFFDEIRSHLQHPSTRDGVLPYPQLAVNKVVLTRFDATPATQRSKDYSMRNVRRSVIFSDATARNLQTQHDIQLASSLSRGLGLELPIQAIGDRITAAATKFREDILEKLDEERAAAELEFFTTRLQTTGITFTTSDI